MYKLFFFQKPFNNKNKKDIQTDFHDDKEEVTEL